MVCYVKIFTFSVHMKIFVISWALRYSFHIFTTTLYLMIKKWFLVGIEQKSLQKVGYKYFFCWLTFLFLIYLYRILRMRYKHNICIKKFRLKIEFFPSNPSKLTIFWRRGENCPPDLILKNSNIFLLNKTDLHAAWISLKKLSLLYFIHQNLD